MQLPILQSAPRNTTVKTVQFGGINRGSYANDGQLADSKNISLDDYPALTPRRAKKVILEGMENPQAVYSYNGKLAYIDGTDFYFDGEKKGSVSRTEKQITAITDRIIIFPDKMCFDISDGKLTALECEYKATGATFTENSITVTGDDFAFKDGDAIEITGCTVNKGNNRSVVIKSVDGKVLNFNDSTFTAGEETAEVTFKRSVPDMDFITEYNNRLWGCKGNTIYASKLGDPYNFNVFSGVSSDSYSVDVGSQGEFTGVAAYTSQIVFFKENCIHKLMGTKPSSFSIVTSIAPGVQKGCERSICNIQDTIFYKAVNGVMAFTGNIPESISDVLGTTKYVDAVAGADSEKYYICLEDSDGKKELMIFDVAKGLWIKEGEIDAIDFTYHQGHLCYIDGSDKKVYSCNHREEKERFDWYREFRETEENAVHKKGYMRLYIDRDCEPDSEVRILVNYDRKGWQLVYNGMYNQRKIIRVPLMPERCGICSFRIEGRGYSRIKSLTREVIAKGV
ncbi:MAG: hypothetical protein IJ410_03580 [Oscillospiraceae bacterium]|nr:hypothetical protein [Oscillospiraceae bacterium]